MSTRRSTRVSSRASSVAASDIGATPRRSSRRQNGTSPLPAIAAKQSTSYGSGMAVAPTTIIQGGYDRDLTNVLAGIVTTVEPELDGEVEELVAPPPDTPSITKGRGRGGRAASVPRTPGADITVSYLGESSLFGDADFGEASRLATPGRANQQRRANRQRQPTIPEEGVDEVDPLPEDVRPVAIQNGPPVAWAQAVNQAFSQLLPIFSSIIKGVSLLAMILVFASCFWEVSQLGDNYLAIRSQTVGLGVVQPAYDWIPSLFTRRINYLTGDDSADLHKQIDILKKATNMNTKAILLLDANLPQFLVFKKDRDGQRHIPMEFWLALQEKIESEYPTLTHDSAQTQRTTGHAQIEGTTGTAWEDFLQQNKAKMEAWLFETFEGPYSEKLREAFRSGSDVIPKADAIELIARKYEDMQRNMQGEMHQYLKEEMVKFKKDVDFSLSQLNQSLEEEVRATARETFIEMYAAKAQVNAMAGTDMQGHISSSLLRVNHFSIGIGAVVNPYVTSPTFEFSRQRANTLTRTLLWLSGNALPSPNRPSTALVKWDEAGECWCSPSTGHDSGVQLGVLLANDIYPDEVVIEHIPVTATLDHASMPKDMQLFAKIVGAENLEKVGLYSEKIFPAAVEQSLDESWVLLGEWRYEFAGQGHIQAFFPQVELRHLKVSTRELVVRAKSNWGESDHTCLYRVRVHGDVAQQK